MSENPPGPTRARLSGFDGLRAVAAFEVMSTHILGHAGYWWLSGRNFGTTILFMMSGYLLYRPHARAHLAGAAVPSIRVFAVRRFFRIFPGYWVVLIAVIVALPLGTHGTPWWVRQVLLLQDYVPNSHIPGWENLWSLGTEVGFYAFLPLAAWLLSVRTARPPASQFRFEVAVLLAVVPVSYAFRVAVLGLGWLNPLTASYWMPSFAAWFAVGMTFAVMSEWNKLNPSRPSAWRTLANDQITCLVLAVVCFGVSATALGGTTFYVPITVEERLFRETFAAGTALFLLLPCMLGTRPRGPWTDILNTKVVSGVGAWAYGIYLWHLPVISWLERVLPMPGGLAGLVTLFVATVSITLPLAWLLHRLVEQPAIDLSRRLTPSGRPLAPPTPEAVVSGGTPERQPS